MRIISLLLAALLLASSSVQSAAFVTFEALAVSTSAVPITAAILDPAGQLQQNRCTVQAQAEAVRYRWDGTDPTTTVGVILTVGSSITIESHEDAARIRFIRDDASDSTLAINCWQQPNTTR